ncbi:uncharacterized protein LOC141607961 [Silene latifolia]|uniref:uncharacterized protein LOC141607961 n=1 Tax=Silene latifolia TaxID=37657 RepID=UPI003D77761E
MQWNKAAIGKYVWWVMQKKDHLWVKWVHNIYIKHRYWLDYSLNVGASWAWRSICRVKEELRVGYSDGWWLEEDGVYTISKGYQWLRGDKANVEWCKWVWSILGILKHNFITWLAVLKRLLTKDRMCKMFNYIEEECDLCGNGKEDNHHLFFTCPYMEDIGEWWTRKQFHSQIEADSIAAVLGALFYNIWWVRNTCRLTRAVIRPEVVLQKIKEDIKHMILAHNQGPQLNWLNL